MATKPSEYHLNKLRLPKPVLEIARRNRVLSEQERQILLELVGTYKKQVLDLELAIAKLKGVSLGWWEINQTKKMQAQLNLTALRINACRGLLSSFQQVPVEILLEIFYSYCSDIPQAPHSDADQDQPSLSPLILAGVCSVWRRVAMSSPRLWQHLKLLAQEQDIGATHAQMKTQHFKVVTKWMDRIENTPWSLHLRTSPSSVKESRAPKPFMSRPPLGLRALLQHGSMAHLRYLHIDADRYNRDIALLPLPSLQSLVLNWAKVNSSLVNSPAQKYTWILPEAPQLCQIVLVSVITPSYLLPGFPIFYLTHLFIDQGLSSHRFKQILRLCFALRKGCFRLDPEIYEQHDDAFISESLDQKFNQCCLSSPSLLVDLSELTMLGDNPFATDNDDILFPNLTKLRLFVDQPLRYQWSIGSLVNFESLSSIVLASKVLTTNIRDILVPLLTSTPLLSELSLHINTIYEELFDCLTFLPFVKSHALAPFLHSLEFRCSAQRYGPSLVPPPVHQDSTEECHGTTVPHTFPTQKLVDLIRSRRKRISTKLQKFDLRLTHAGWSHQILDDVRDGLRMYEADGLQMNLSVDAPRNGKGIPSQKYYTHWDYGLMEVIDKYSYLEFGPTE